MSLTRACSVFGCGQIMPCSRHSRRNRKPTDAQGKPRTTSERGYGWRWQKASATFLKHYPLCGDRPDNMPPVMSRCYDEGRAVQAKQVDHIVPHKGDSRLFWDTRHNWQSLCASCGTRKSRAGL